MRVCRSGPRFRRWPRKRIMGKSARPDLLASHCRHSVEAERVEIHRNSKEDNRAWIFQPVTADPLQRGSICRNTIHPKSVFEHSTSVSGGKLLDALPPARHLLGGPMWGFGPVPIHALDHRKLKIKRKRYFRKAKRFNQVLRVHVCVSPEANI